MANANASRICHLLDIYDRHHGDEMNEEKGTRCNELMVLGKYLMCLESTWRCLRSTRMCLQKYLHVLAKCMDRGTVGSADR